MRFGYGGYRSFETTAATPALALCIVCLEARLMELSEAVAKWERGGLQNR